ncbi:hypothetical protein ASE86_02585 [Sphingomonas sp. Leaf33]|nr:hypothetical protein ASE86_02585 [Sphingomonas sp. Leaf33]
MVIRQRGNIMIGFAIALGLAATTPVQTPPPAAASPAQALGQCMAMKTTGEDRILVARWMLVAMASGPQMTGVVTVQPGQKEKYDRGMATLFTRLLVTDCPDLSRAVFKLRDNAAFRVAGESLGQVAMQELLTNPQASAALGAYVKYLDLEAFKKVTTP